MGVGSTDLPAAQMYRNYFRQNNQDPKWTPQRRRKIKIKVPLSFQNKASFQIASLAS